MSLYNMIFGVNPLAETLLSIIDMTPEKAGRLRDVFLVMGESGPEVHVYTRNGGGNREHWADTEHGGGGEHCHCTGCTITHHLPKHPLYLGDEDDGFDCTYATVRFRVPETMREWLAALAASEDQRTPVERWREFFHKLENKPDDADVKRVVAAAGPIMEKLAELAGLNKGG